MRCAVSATLCRDSWLALLLALNCSPGSQHTDFDGGGDALPTVNGAGRANDDQEAETSAGAGGKTNTGTIDAAGDFSGETSSGQAGAHGGEAPVGGATAGAAGAAPGAGAASTGSSGRAGNAGTNGIAGSGGGPAGAAKACAEACARDQDCTIDDQDRGFRCNPLTRRCEKPGFPCAAASECLPAASLWFWDCSAPSDCFYFSDDVCVNVAGIGKCARLAPGGDGASSGCEAPTPDAVLLPQLDGGQSVLVCADAGNKCEAGACVPACRGDVECGPARNGSVCDLATGSCRCIEDDDCGAAGVSRCNLATGVCECASDRDCEELPGSDVCVQGKCSCGSAEACSAEPLFSGTRFVCE